MEGFVRHKIERFVLTRIFLKYVDDTKLLETFRKSRTKQLQHFQGRNLLFNLMYIQVTCFAEAGGQHVSGMAKAVELLGLRACLTQSIMDCGEGLPAPWAAITTDDCIQVYHV